MRFVKHACLGDYRLHLLLRLRSRYFSVSVLLKNYCWWNYVWNKHQSWRKVQKYSLRHNWKYYGIRNPVYCWTTCVEGHGVYKERKLICVTTVCLMVKVYNKIALYFIHTFVCLNRKLHDGINEILWIFRVWNLKCMVMTKFWVMNFLNNERNLMAKTGCWVATGTVGAGPK